MIFSSVTFLSLFLPVVYLVYQVLPGIRAKNFWLMCASLVFYSFGRLKWLPILLFSVVCNYVAGLFVAQKGPGRKPALVIAVLVNLGILCFFKYLDFGAGILNGILGTHIPLLKIELPIGISFFTFQGMSYVIDVYRNPEEGTKDLGKVLLYISFFPQLVAGPIVRYLDVAKQMDERTGSAEETARGIMRFIQGVSKKLLLADGLGRIADTVFALSAGEIDIRLAWLGAICYTLQIYLDFSGYSDMAIGLGHMFGFTFRENFDHPYCSGSITEFWRRWHISLSTWFREYVYIPLGGNRCSPARVQLNRFAVFFLTGLWHGANWTYIFWGLWHGLLRTLEGVFHLDKRFGKSVIGHIYTMLAVILGFVLFRAESLTEALNMFRAMFTGFSFTAESQAIFANLCSPILLFTLAVGVIISVPAAPWLHSVLERRGGRGGAVVLKLAWPATIVLLLLCQLNLAASSFSPFIYFQF